jgi:5-formyltetrahydrofolate cyclo-ligase
LQAHEIQYQRQVRFRPLFFMNHSKSQMRQEARQKRAALKPPDFAAAIASYAGELDIAPDTVVGGYHALGDEADPALLLEMLAEMGCTIAFPRVVAKNQALEFHHVPEGYVLMPGTFGIHEPLAHWPLVTPAVLLVPLLAFDSGGHRLGYGGGYYDRTLAALKTVRTIGIAYAGQEVETLPHEDHDIRLEAVLTEKGLHQMPGSRR